MKKMLKNIMDLKKCDIYNDKFFLTLTLTHSSYINLFSSLFQTKDTHIPVDLHG